MNYEIDINGKKIKIGDILQGKSSHPVVVIYDTDKQELTTCCIKMKERMNCFGLEGLGEIEYHMTCPIKEFIEYNRNYQILGNMLQVNLSNVYRKAGEPFTKDWKIVCLEDGNYKG